MNEPEAKNEETDGERGERVVGAAVRAVNGVDLDNVGSQSAVSPFAGEDADTSVAGAAVGLDDVRGEAGVVSNYLSILTL